MGGGGGERNKVGGRERKKVGGREFEEGGGGEKESWREGGSVRIGTCGGGMYFTWACAQCRLLNRQVDEWGDLVTVVSCDMRQWDSPEKVRQRVCRDYSLPK